MNAQTKMSEKGQIVIPKDVRERLGLLPGDRLDVIERLDGVLLRKPSIKSGESFDRITARIHARMEKYRQPPLSIEDMGRVIDEAAADHAVTRDERARD